MISRLLVWLSHKKPKIVFPKKTTPQPYRLVQANRQDVENLLKEPENKYLVAQPAIFAYLGDGNIKIWPMPDDEQTIQLWIRL